MRMVGGSARRLGSECSGRVGMLTAVRSAHVSSITARGTLDPTHLLELDEQCASMGKHLVAESKQGVLGLLSALQFGATSGVDHEYADRFSSLFERTLEGNEQAFAAVGERWRQGGDGCFDNLVENGAVPKRVAEELALGLRGDVATTSLFGSDDPVGAATVLLCNCWRRHDAASDEFVAIVRYDPSPRDRSRGLQPMWVTYTASKDGLGIALLRWLHEAMQDSSAAPEHLPLRWRLHDINFATTRIPEANEMLGVVRPVLDELVPSAALLASAGAVLFLQYVRF